MIIHDYHLKLHVKPMYLESGVYSTYHSAAEILGSCQIIWILCISSHCALLRTAGVTPTYVAPIGFIPWQWTTPAVHFSNAGKMVQEPLADQIAVAEC